ncbi:prephenate dehydratase [Phyllosticta citriasiana]|uniref:prephenate dehydratase n=1 Tax=Phyllosticta citriasiana TaxID=595635 RepID=A0ABR1L1G0_9PEZI
MTQETVAFLGPRASYTHQAALDSFDEQKYNLRPAVNIEDVFAAVQHDEASHGVVPVENSSNGAVIFTLDLFADLKDRFPDILICGEAYVRIQHCLLGRAPPKSPIANDVLTSPNDSGAATPTLDTPDPAKPQSKPLVSISHVKKLYSHPQAWGQCKNFLNAYLKGIERQDCSSTSRAAEEAAKDKTGCSAAISSATAAKMHGLDFLAQGINDFDDNTTRFFVLRRRGSSEMETLADSFSPREHAAGASDEDMDNYKSLVSFTVEGNNPGALADSLGVFKPYKLNLTSVNTRPSGVEKWNYIFFVEFRGRRLEGTRGAVNGALRDLGKVAKSWRWLGSWQSKSSS